ncbi:hypothetical protein KTN05_15385 [Paracoccus sp. Z118]|uniref:hypothetical protein n=1 Tax=Paracoccus sp. Z118 TaxID=2851017 RepID=UPI001C2C2393|nr:hypothetical protein [Paracoccus sp. Z118]MBV0893196.1 hypothetical protein [Paracoccus sp. Z118]
MNSHHAAEHVLKPAARGRALAWALAALTLLANVAGYALDLYQRFWWFDRVLHGGTILAITFWLGLFVLAPRLHPRKGRGLVATFLLASVGIALGALWEVAEWGADFVLTGNVIKGKNDTILDLIMDTAESSECEHQPTNVG